MVPQYLQHWLKVIYTFIKDVVDHCRGVVKLIPQRFNLCSREIWSLWHISVVAFTIDTNSFLPFKHAKLEQSRISLTIFSLVLNVDSHCFIPTQLTIMDLRSPKYCFLCANKAGQSSSMCTISSLSVAQHLQIELSVALLNLSVRHRCLQVGQFKLTYVSDYLSWNIHSAFEYHSCKIVLESVLFRCVTHGRVNAI